MVDLFFWMSGFLGTFLLLVNMKKKNGKMPSALFLYVHRYLRLLPMYVGTMLLYWKIMPLFGSGPTFFRYYEKQADECNSWWWTHLLYINNLHPWNALEDCMGWTWYLPNDF